MEIERRGASLNLRRAKLGVSGGFLGRGNASSSRWASWRVWALELHRAAWGGFPLYLSQPACASSSPLHSRCKDFQRRFSVVSEDQAKGYRRQGNSACLFKLPW